MIRLVKEISPDQREWRNDSRIMAWTRGSECLSKKDQDEWLEKIERDKTISMFGIEVMEEGGVPLNIGTCGLTSISMIHRTAEWSLLISPQYQGKGYGKAAFKLLLEYGFYNLGLNRIWGEIFDGNDASFKLAARYGFREEGKLRQSYFKNGAWVNSTLVGLLRGDYDLAS